MSSLESIKEIISKKVISYKDEEDTSLFTEDDGKWIFDFRLAFFQGKYLQQFSSFFWDKYEKEYPFQVWGLELSAVPFISGIVLEWLKRWKNVNGFIIRKERKDSGLWKKIEWNINKEKIIIVDDLINSGSSLSMVYNTLHLLERKIYKVYVFVHFWKPSVKKILLRYQILLEYSFVLSDFGIDIFQNSISHPKDKNKFPVIYPASYKLFSWNGANKFVPAMKSNPIRRDKYIYVWWEGGVFSCICSNTGEVRWQFTVEKTRWHKNILSSPCIVWETVIFGAYDGNLYALNINTGEVLWKNTEADWIGSSPIFSEYHGYIYIWLEHASSTHKWSLIAVDKDSWEKRWSYVFLDFVHCSPIYSEKNDIVVCGDNSGRLVWIDGKSWTVKWVQEFGCPIKWWFGFSQDQKNVYFWDFEGNMNSINIYTGEIQFRFLTGNAIYTVPFVSEYGIFFGSLDKKFYHIDDSWKLIRKITTFWKIFSSPICIEDAIIVFGSNDGYIYFYDSYNKKNLFVVEHGERITTKILFNKEFKTLYVYDYMNQLYIYDAWEYL